MKVNIVLWSLGLIAAVGCATPYQQSGYRGGFTETRLAPDIFAISFAGNSFTSPERVSDFASAPRSGINAQQKGTTVSPCSTSPDGHWIFCFQHFGSQIFSG